MTDQEKINAEVQMKLAMQDAKFNVFMQEMRDFKAEMRDRDNQRAAEIRNLDNQVRNLDNKRTAEMRELDNKRMAEMRELDNKRESAMREIRSSIQNVQNSMRDMQASNSNLNIVTIIGIAAIVIAVLLK